MLRTTLAGLRMHTSRLVTTVLAIVLGVMFVTGTMVFSDSLEDGLSTQVMGDAESVSTIALADDGTTAADEEPAELSQQILADIAALPEVADVGGIIHGDAPLLDQEGRAVGTMPTVGLSVSDSTRHSPAEGELPASDDEVALATASADVTGYGVGDEVQILDPEGEKRTFTVTGLLDLGVEQELSYRGAVAFTEDTTREMTGTDGFAEINATGAPGYPDSEVTDAVDAVVPNGTEVLTGAAYGEQLAENAGADIEMLSTALLLAALVSIVVAGIVIYNTFAILLAQRQHEMALLRCVGARRGQVLRSVLLEALLVGLLASTMGVLAGIGVGYAGFTLGADAFNVEGATGPTVGLTAVLTGLLVGTGMTLVSALLPALRAARVSPLAALRASGTAHGMGRGAGWVRTVVGAVLALVSAGIVGGALRLPEGEQAALVAVAVAGIVAFVGVVALGPLLVRAVVAVAGVPMRRIGVVSMLAADNSRRAPKRAATAVIALTVGATLITGYSVISASVETTLTQQLDEQFPVDYAISPQFTPEDQSDGTEAGVDPEVAERLDGEPGIASVISQRRSADVPQDTTVSAYFGGEVGDDIASPVESGDLADLGPGRVVAHEDEAGESGVGDTLTVPTEKGEREFEIAAVTSGSGTLQGVVMAPEDFREHFPEITHLDSVNVRASDDVDPHALRDTVHSAVEDDPTLQVQSAAQVKGEFTDILDSMFLAVTAMLGLAILIAVFGIANTMALSVLERTRESALLRALGLSRRQLGRMLTLEAVLLCLTGAAIGVGLGVLFGWAAAAASLPDLVLRVPGTQVAVFLGVAVVAGLLASFLPSRAAGRTSITGALASE